jgi:peptidyl-prolyl cis-trans isomerase B (cyclophilin B)
VAAGCGDDDDDGGDAASTETAPADTQSDSGDEKQLAELDPGKTYLVRFVTNRGEFTVELDQKTSPNTAASVAALVKDGFYDGTVFHRIVPGFVIQGGDPTGSGQGGPGYSVVDEPPADTRYVHGVVAMAKTATEPPGTSGSQFYVVTGADAQLPADYAVLGKVTKGLGVVDKIGKLGDPATEMPTERVVIKKATLEES